MKITLSLLLYLIRDLDPVVLKAGRKDAAFEGVHRFVSHSSAGKSEKQFLQIGSLSELTDGLSESTDELSEPADGLSELPDDLPAIGNEETGIGPVSR